MVQVTFRYDQSLNSVWCLQKRKNNIIITINTRDEHHKGIYLQCTVTVIVREGPSP